MNLIIARLLGEETIGVEKLMLKHEKERASYNIVVDFELLENYGTY